MTGRVLLVGGVPGWLTGALYVLALGTAACTANSRIAVPAELPNRTELGDVQTRWALVQEPGAVRAVGIAESPNRFVSRTTVGLVGVDANGRVVSQGQGDIRGGLGSTSGPFEVALRPTGREARFELVLAHIQEGKPGD
jgi:hypothetical protein